MPHHSSGAMEAALVTAASRFMFQKVTDLLQLDKKLMEMMGIETKMQKLKELSTIIDAVIEDVESRPSIGYAVKDLLKKLKYLSYDLEDVVDHYDTKVSQKKQRSSPVHDFFSPNNQLWFNFTVGGMIKAITESLDSILLQKSILLNLPQGNIRMSEPSLYNRETHSRNSFEVIGREPEKNKIVDMLTKDADDESINHGTVNGGASPGHLSRLFELWQWALRAITRVATRVAPPLGTVKVIAIVGMGGLGKTTLAQLVFNDEKVKAHFASSRMWTVVGVEFDPANIMKSVLEQATNAPVNISQIDLLRQNLEKALSGKRFLLVLDDVWNENESKWNVLKAALSTCGVRGSKILVTTRSQQVSSIMGSSNTTHQIQQLSRDDCLSLFQQSAFRDQAVDQNLMKIGGKIIEKCGGVPLAAISLGSMLRRNRDENYWSSALKSEIWQLGNEEQKVLAVLKLGYDTLPPRSKKCFAFASLFPKNDSMAKDELIQLWIANGFVRSEGNFDAETNGKDVFNDLVMGSFFLLEDDGHVTKCMMHDLMHDLARSVSTDVYWNSDQDSVENIGKRTYHLQINASIKFPNMTQVVLGKRPLYLRTFMSRYSVSHSNINLLEVFSELKFLRVLNVTAGDIKEVPESIGNLIHLRYLNLSKNYITVLPDSITLLPNLWYLNLSMNKIPVLLDSITLPPNLRYLNLSMNKITILPDSITLLPNLWYLDLSWNSITVLPDSISLLPNLRYLNLSLNSMEVLPDSITLLSNLQHLDLSSNYGLRELPKELGNMQNLRNLDLKGNFGLTHMPCGLSQLTNLQSLPFFIGGDKTGTCSIIELEDLKLRGEMAIKFSNNFMNYSCGGRKILKNKDLNELCIVFNDSERYDKDMLDDLCPNKTSLEKLDIYGYGSPQFPSWLIELQLPNLIEVCIGGWRVCEHIPPFGNLKFLKKLDLSFMGNITQMGVEFHGYGGFPSLQELSLNQMDNLEEWSESHVVNQLFPLLQELRISNCPKLKSMPRLPRIQELVISSCSETILSCVGRLTSLSVLTVEKMGDMTSLSGGCIRNLASLTQLRIIDCRQLERVPRDLKNLYMLKTLNIVDCPQLKSRFERDTGEDWPIISHIPRVII